MKQKHLLVLPLCSILLLGAAPISKETTPLTSINIGTYRPNYRNDVDYFVVSAVRKDTPTLFYFCFSTSSKYNIVVNVYYVDPVSNGETLVFTKSNMIGTTLIGSFSYMEEHDESYYSSNSWGGPKFRAEFLFNRNTVQKILRPKFASARYTYLSLEDKSQVMTSDESILLIAYSYPMGYVSESFKFALPSDEIDLTGDNSLSFDFPYLEMENRPIRGVSLPSFNGSYVVVDMHGHFRDEIKRQDAVYFDGNYEIKDGYVRFNHTPTYYIDPKTRVLYPNNAAGRLLIRKLYYPINAHQIIENSQYKDFPGYLATTGLLGFSKVNIGALLSVYISDANILGPCYSSGYCITSTDSRSDIE